MPRGFDLWIRFRDTFLASAREIDPSRLANRSERTRAYGLGRRGQEGLLPSLVPKLGMLRFDQEYLGADGVFVREGGWPEIYVESENDAADSWREIERLAYLRAPLKVLITTMPTPSIEQRWAKDIQAAHEWLSESGESVYGFLILEEASVPRFRSLVLDGRGCFVDGRPGGW